MWIPALSAIGAGFAIGLAAIGSGVGQALLLRMGTLCEGLRYSGLGFGVWGFRGMSLDVDFNSVLQSILIPASRFS